MTRAVSQTLKDVNRVVVRGDHAVALWRKGGKAFPSSWWKAPGRWI